jgi:hypothetical protein
MNVATQVPSSQQVLALRPLCTSAVQRNAQARSACGRRGTGLKNLTSSWFGKAYQF